MSPRPTPGELVFALTVGTLLAYGIVALIAPSNAAFLASLILVTAVCAAAWLVLAAYVLHTRSRGPASGSGHDTARDC